MKTFEDNCICKKNHTFHWKVTIREENDGFIIGKMSDLRLHCIDVNENKNCYILTLQCPICNTKEYKEIKKN